MKLHLMFLVGLLAGQTASGGAPDHGAHDDGQAATHHGHHDSAHGAGNRAVGQPGHPDRIDRSIAVIASDTMRYDPPEITVRPGETIRFEVKNDGKLRHEFTIGDATEQRAHSEMMKRDPDMVHDDANTITLEAGERKTLVWQFGEAGELEIGCHVPGHYEAGMLARVRVIASNNSQ
ncbi:MAG: cupredoxin family protein [Pseudomonadota bacterium]|nr:cupredoxin family protein [Pseudomonadota bacterium]